MDDSIICHETVEGEGVEERLNGIISKMRPASTTNKKKLELNRLKLLVGRLAQRARDSAHAKKNQATPTKRFDYFAFCRVDKSAFELF